MGNNMYEIISQYLSDIESGKRTVTSKDYVCLTKLCDKILQADGKIREVLFRGKDNTGKWNYGFYVKSPYPDGNDGPIMHGIVLQCYVESFDYPGRTGKRDWKIIQVDPTTVGQYTGIKDNYGKKIFEGDIVKLGYYNSVFENTTYDITSVDFKDGTFRFLDCSGDDCPYEMSCDYEVIGNIYDNPELLESDKPE